MNTLTLFRAYVKARNINRAFAGKCIESKYQARHLRLWRQIDALEARIYARLTPPALRCRRRVFRVSIGNSYAFFDRDGEDTGDGYRMTSASRRRVLRTCEEHMHGDGWMNAYGVMVFTREVQP
jgi:hypothetical protein